MNLKLLNDFFLNFKIQASRLSFTVPIKLGKKGNPFDSIGMKLRPWNDQKFFSTQKICVNITISDIKLIGHKYQMNFYFRTDQATEG